MSELTSIEKAEFIMALKAQAKMEGNIQTLVNTSHAAALEQGILLGKIEGVAEDITDIKDHLGRLNGKVAEHEDKIHQCEVDRTAIKTKVMVTDTPVNTALSNLRTEWRTWGAVGGLVFAAALILAEIFLRG